MTEINKIKSVIGIASLIFAAKVQANVKNEVLYQTLNENEFENLDEKMKLVGFAPEKALKTLESLAHTGASHFNNDGEIQVRSDVLPIIIRAATDDNLEVQIQSSDRVGFVKMKFSDSLTSQADLRADEFARLKDMSEYFKLSCHGGGIVP